MAIDTAVGSFTIPNGTAVSNSVLANGAAIKTLLLPAAWTAAALRVQGSFDGTNWSTFADTSNTANTMTVAADALISLTVYHRAPYLRVQSHTGGTATNQGAERIIRYVLEK